jgi:hypothetical protein
MRVLDFKTPNHFWRWMHCRDEARKWWGIGSKTKKQRLATFAARLVVWNMKQMLRAEMGE